MVAISTSTSAAPVSDSKNITVRVVIPAKINAKVVEQGQLCVAGSGVGKFRLQSQGETTIDQNDFSTYSQPYSIHTNQIAECKAGTTTLAFNQADSSIIIAAE
ncbi:hypothetical protein PAHA111176_03355 [Parendozoicomonas haliclonae]|uniref:Uncharacterized protein n=2 Tax=Parendozoicomonas haliclonae TaxID=1960125 RepID=A0A1X7AIX8_9GAMM|nr:hypothetical protein EHSB41UT_02034 [Parendozoicomonas haliclonae]